MNEKETQFTELIAVKEQYRKKLESNLEYSQHLKNINLKLVEQINSLIKTKMIR